MLYALAVKFASSAVDVYNPSNREVSLVIRAPEMPEVTIQLKPDSLRRIRTSWRGRPNAVFFESRRIGKPAVG